MALELIFPANIHSMATIDPPLKCYSNGVAMAGQKSPLKCYSNGVAMAGQKWPAFISLLECLKPVHEFQLL